MGRRIIICAEKLGKMTGERRRGGERKGQNNSRGITTVADAFSFWWGRGWFFVPFRLLLVFLHRREEEEAEVKKFKDGAGLCWEAPQSE